jgi:transposase
MAPAYSPRDNPVERIWAALRTDLANIAVAWTECTHQTRIFFRHRTLAPVPLTTAGPWNSRWLPKG